MLLCLDGLMKTQNLCYRSLMWTKTVKIIIYHVKCVFNSTNVRSLVVDILVDEYNVDLKTCFTSYIDY